MRETQAGFLTTGQHDGALILVVEGPTVGVRIGFDETFDPKKSVRPDLPDALYPALVDTGASESCIDTDLASVLRLPIVDRGDVSGVGGAIKVNIYAAQIIVPPLNLNIYGRFAGVSLQAGGQRHQALLGRTFLQRTIMEYDGTTGSVILRIPTAAS